MKRDLLTTIVLVFLIAACGPASDTPIGNDVPSDPGPGDYSPSQADSKLTRDVVYLDSTDLLTMESYPLQFALVLKGNLPTPCNKLRIAVGAPDAENKIIVDVYSITDPATACILVLQPFEVNIPLGSFDTGHYTLWVNGDRVAGFDA